MTPTETRPAPAVVDLRDHPAAARPTSRSTAHRPAVLGPVDPARAARRARLVRLQAADVRESTLLHARLRGRRR